MTYYGDPGISWKKGRLGIKPTRADHNAVHAWSVMGMTINEIAERLGKRFNLAKPMSRMSLYYHFRKDIIPRPKGRRASDETVRIRINKNIAVEMKRLIEEAGRRGKK